MATAKKTGNKNSNRNRFNEDQIKFLETMFESESRPELRLKQHLASKLGLEPRQVAIWFQNKRARSKSRQIEQDYSILKTEYDNLAAQFENLQKENQTLVNQLQTLKNKRSDGIDSEELEEKKNQFSTESSKRPTFLLEDHTNGLCMPICSDMSGKFEYLDDADVLSTGQIAGGPFTPSENGCSFDSCTFLDNTDTDSQWWNI